MVVFELAVRKLLLNASVLLDGEATEPFHVHTIPFPSSVYIFPEPTKITWKRSHPTALPSVQDSLQARHDTSHRRTPALTADRAVPRRY